MFRCSPVHARRLHGALLLFLSLTCSIEAIADSGDYRIHDATLPTGIRVIQQVDTATFPQAEGKRPSLSQPDAPRVDAGHSRSVRALIPRNSPNDFALALPSGSAYVNVDFYNHALVVRYGGPSVVESANPFSGAHHSATWDGSATRRWAKVINIGRKISSNATHFLVTLYVLPRLGGQTERTNTSNLVVSVNEATVQGMNVVNGRTLAGNIVLAVNEGDWTRWREEPIRAGTMPDIGNGPLDQSAAITSRLPFVDQRTIDLRHDVSERRRDKRCIDNVLYYVSTAMAAAFMEVMFGRPDLCSLDPHPHQDVGAGLPLVEVTPPDDVPRFVEPTVFEAAALEPEQLNASAAFDAAMNVQFCNANHVRQAGDQHCTEFETRAIAAIGTLTPRQIGQLLAQIGSMLDPDRPGTSTATLSTGDSELDRWLNADLMRASNALNAAQAIVHVSDARQEPDEPIKNEEKDARELVKASCIETAEDDDASEDGFQKCVRKANKRLHRTGPVVALPPLVESNERSHQRGTAQFDRLVRQFRNSGRGMPWGMSEAELPRFTAAIARDQAPTGDNLGFVFINDPTSSGTQGRFRYGVEHIWTAGAGGGDDAGHREDWRALRGLNVNGRDMLVQIVMAALTDPSARFVQETSSRNGNVIRTFDYFMFRHGNTPYAIRNVRIVLAQNGMVITAYPLRHAYAEPLKR